jgi:predicted phosphodiesterase
VKVERAGPSVEPKDGNQQRRGGNESKQEELEGGFGSVFAAVHGDEDGHGDERQFPEAVVEHQVERDEDAEHGGLLDEKEREEDFAALLMAFQLASTPMGASRPVRTTSQRLRPSMPTW